MGLAILRLRRIGNSLLGVLHLRAEQSLDDQAAETIQDLKREIVSLREGVEILEQANLSLSQRVIQISGRAERAEHENQCMHEQLSRMESENERMRSKADEIERIVDDTRATFEQLEQYNSRLELSLGEEVAGLRAALVASEREKHMLRTLLRSLMSPRGRSRAMRSLPSRDFRGPGRWNQEGGGDTDDSDD
ncbi:hypothetical protein GQ53DRAFT_830372 [Thozetella sp. PMI_491]|nr:hypothetical protein GQ53DRAFT_830372 [Thozetella sp. PMI_491]